MLLTADLMLQPIQSGEMAPLVKGLLHKHEDLSLDTQHWWYTSITASLGRAKTGVYTAITPPLGRVKTGEYTAITPPLGRAKTGEQ